MRSVLMIFLVFFALPALAQQEPECRGKKGFTLGDGAYGCLLDIVDSSMSRSQSKALNGGEIHSSSQIAAGLVVAIFGDYDKSHRVTNSRFRQICKAYRDEVKTAMVGTPYRKVIVRMYWLRLAVPNSTDPLAQTAYMSKKCTNVGRFGRRSS
ncbi:MAG: hypothetical protein JKY94_15580 [Rhodobacteraceae bacterium]|nr:hypothetical protein [Paracoccaceae bacterium]